jgi:hypothetical protein
MMKSLFLSTGSPPADTATVRRYPDAPVEGQNQLPIRGQLALAPTEQTSSRIAGYTPSVFGRDHCEEEHIGTSETFALVPGCALPACFVIDACWKCTLVNLMSRNQDVHDETLNLQDAAAFLQMSTEALRRKAKSRQVPGRQHREPHTHDAQGGPLGGTVRVSANP